MLNVRLPEKLINDYKNFCEANSWIMSKRIRKLMEADLLKWAKYMEDKIAESKIVEQQQTETKTKKTKKD